MKEKILYGTRKGQPDWKEYNFYAYKKKETDNLVIVTLIKSMVNGS